MAKTTPQYYPRIEDEESRFYGCLDDSKLVPHRFKIPVSTLRKFILNAIKNANIKTSRAILNIPNDTTQKEIETIYVKQGKELFKYFKKYCNDPASTSHDIYNRHYEEICKQQFNIRTIQKERMNSGWRYQYLAGDCANESGRFRSVSDIGAAEADFNAVIDFIEDNKDPLSLYVSIKNRSNTMGGQDWPKAIHALEEIAKNDKNRIGFYCCIFGIVMDRGQRRIKYEQKTKQPYSMNTEVWLSDFFWPFFSNYSYEEIMTLVLNTLIEIKKFKSPLEVPELLIETFGKQCREKGLINDDGYFNDPHKLVQFFCEK